MKKFFIFTVLVVLTSGMAFAQEHWIGGEASLFGAGFRYEYMLSDKMSIGANVYWSTLIWMSDASVDFSFRGYPTDKKVLYLGFGVGFHYQHTLFSFFDNNRYKSNFWRSKYGVAFTPDIGWKIDVGDKGGFYVSPGVKIPITIGSRYGSWLYGVSRRFAFGFNIIPYIGLGYAL